MRKHLFILAMLCSTISFGQQYSTAIGIKGGYPGYGSLNLKHFLGGSNAIEASVGGGAHHVWLQGLYERNAALEGGLDWYWGLGADLGFWSNGYSYYHKKSDRYYSGAWGGLDAVIGMEYTFEEVPINIAADLGPTIRLFPYVGFGWGGAVALRYAIK